MCMCVFARAHTCVLGVMLALHMCVFAGHEVKMKGQEGDERDLCSHDWQKFCS